MKFIIDNWLLIAVALASGGMLLWPVLRGSGALGTAAAVRLINREKALVIDVSEAGDYARAHVGGARNVPLEQFADKLPTVARNKATPLILVCPTGGRANRAVPLAKKLGYEQAQALAGGLKAWKEANLPVEGA